MRRSSCSAATSASTSLASMLRPRASYAAALAVRTVVVAVYGPVAAGHALVATAVSIGIKRSTASDSAAGDGGERRAGVKPGEHAGASGDAAASFRLAPAGVGGALGGARCTCAVAAVRPAIFVGSTARRGRSRRGGQASREGIGTFRHALVPDGA